MKRKLKVGDRVKESLFGFGNGTIIGIRDSTIPFIVEFDKGNSEIFHDGFSATKIVYGKNKGKDNHCFWCTDEELELVKEENQDYVTRAEFEEFKKSINKPIEKTEDKFDNYHFKMDNYYLTKEEAQRAKEIQDILFKYSYDFYKEELENTNAIIIVNRKYLGGKYE